MSSAAAEANRDTAPTEIVRLFVSFIREQAGAFTVPGPPEEELLRARASALMLRISLAPPPVSPPTGNPRENRIPFLAADPDLGLPEITEWDSKKVVEHNELRWQKGVELLAKLPPQKQERVLEVDEVGNLALSPRFAEPDRESILTALSSLNQYREAIEGSTLETAVECYLADFFVAGEAVLKARWAPTIWTAIEIKIRFDGRRLQVSSVHITVQPIVAKINSILLARSPAEREIDRLGRNSSTDDARVEPTLSETIAEPQSKASHQPQSLIRVQTAAQSLALRTEAMHGQIVNEEEGLSVSLKRVGAAPHPVFREFPHQWGQIKMVVQNDSEILIGSDTIKADRFTFKDLHFDDARQTGHHLEARQSATKSWWLLLEIARCNTQHENFNTGSKYTPKDAQLLNQHLRDLFGIHYANPIQYDHSQKSYVTLFTLLSEAPTESDTQAMMDRDRVSRRQRALKTSGNNQ